MPTRILEYGPSDVAAMGGYPVVPTRSFLAKQAAFTATSTPTPSTVFQTGTVLVCVESDEQVYVEVALSPAVNTNNHRIAAGENQWFEVPAGGGWSAQVRT